MIVLFSHIRTGKWASIMPVNLAETLGVGGDFRPSRSLSPTPGTSSA
jgi:hypothetical protein